MKHALDNYVLSDIDASGFTLQGRKGLLSLLAAAKRQPRPFDCLLVDNTSRLSRHPVHVLHLIDSLAYYGVQVYFASEQLNSEDAPFAFFF
jgi:DNA invertase Pin-like site-specific DNA recombinase